MRTRFIFWVVIFQLATIHAQFQVIPSGASWKYFSGSAPALNWMDSSFNDIGWTNGFTQMGYGDGDETTVLYGGPDTGNYPTYYFRKQINIPDTSLYPGGFMVRIKRDDAFVFYVNGLQIFQNNTIGLISQYNYLASSPCIDDGNTWITFYFPPGIAVNGINTFAAEVHQYENTGGDLSFDCTVDGLNTASPICIRGPYLQSCTENSVVIKWRTNISSNSVVYIGNTYNVFTDTIFDPTNTYGHEVHLTGLNPGTKYYYTVGSTAGISVQDTAKYFYTPGTSGVPYELDIWVTGDCGTGYINQFNTANAFSGYIGNKYVDSWMILGDNAYLYGLDDEYQSNFFESYKSYRYLSQTCIWPTPGNHDYYNTTNLESRNTPYYKIFTVPTLAEAGGVASNTEQYYSYNLGNVHFISLDSYGTEGSQKMYDTTSLQAVWLKQDLAANTMPWTILYWHHPPYTMGSHNSDIEPDLVAIRSNLVKMIERYKVDLVLCGHSHNYERSKLIKGHYGLENTYDPFVHLTNSSSAYYDGTPHSCPYFKRTDDTVNTGVVYVVAGNAGKHTSTSSGWPHDIMFYSNTINSGSMYLKINDNRLDASFISETGLILDKFTMMKDVNNSYDLLVPASVPVNLTASWIGNYYWENSGDTTSLVMMSFTQDSMVVVQDLKNCIADTFHITVYNLGEESLQKEFILVYPNPTEKNFNITLPLFQQSIIVDIYSMSGKLVFQKKWFATEKNIQIDPGNIAKGAYSLRVMIGKKVYCSKLVIG